MRVTGEQVLGERVERVGFLYTALDDNPAALKQGRIHLVPLDNKGVGCWQEFHRNSPGDVGEATKIGIIWPDKLPKFVESKETSQEEGEKEKVIMRKRTGKRIVDEKEIILCEWLLLRNRGRKLAHGTFEAMHDN